MVHPDYQYDPSLLPDIIQPIVDKSADLVLGSRLRTGSALEQGMPWWKYFANRFSHLVRKCLFRLAAFGISHRIPAFQPLVLEAVNFGMNSDGFVFDQEIIAQAVACKFRIGEIAVPVRYFREASSASFTQSTVYGLRISGCWASTRCIRPLAPEQAV